MNILKYIYITISVISFIAFAATIEMIFNGKFYVPLICAVGWILSFFAAVPYIEIAEYKEEGDDTNGDV